ncbi:hypothetical protein PR202_ga21089 [Eleusine coracana subsp. coracana]|uniref:Uncharacterized protein n=1 Tax=Eleusine coracana subsp. coracana TaxID=191504 RepID=A0AAV5D0H2_ELECO|nr:hypothetical protein PR202_ga21089 [Eleusine coracana subsp. coracana]
MRQSGGNDLGNISSLKRDLADDPPPRGRRHGDEDSLPHLLPTTCFHGRGFVDSCAPLRQAANPAGRVSTTTHSTSKHAVYVLSMFLALLYLG